MEIERIQQQKNFIDMLSKKEIITEYNDIVISDYYLPTKEWWSIEKDMLFIKKIINTELFKQIRQDNNRKGWIHPPTNTSDQIENINHQVYFENSEQFCKSIFQDYISDYIFNLNPDDFNDCLSNFFSIIEYIFDQNTILYFLSHNMMYELITSDDVNLQRKFEIILCVVHNKCSFYQTRKMIELMVSIKSMQSDQEAEKRIKNIFSKLNFTHEEQSEVLFSVFTQKMLNDYIFINTFFFLIDNEGNIKQKAFILFEPGDLFYNKKSLNEALNLNFNKDRKLLILSCISPDDFEFIDDKLKINLMCTKGLSETIRKIVSYETLPFKDKYIQNLIYFFIKAHQYSYKIKHIANKNILFRSNYQRYFDIARELNKKIS